MTLTITSTIPEPAVRSASLHARLHAIVMRQANADIIREELRKLVVQMTGATITWRGVRLAGNWEVVEQFPASKPAGAAMSSAVRERWLAVCQRTWERRLIQIEAMQWSAPGFLLAAPVRGLGQPDEVLSMFVPGDAGFIQNATVVLDVVASYQGLWERARHEADRDWQMTAISVLCEATTRLLRSDHTAATLGRLANDLQAFFGCRRVAIALGSGVRTKLVAISGVAQLNTGLELGQRMRQALVETTMRSEPVLWRPAASTEGTLVVNQGLLAHEKLAREFHFHSLVSGALTGRSGKVIGAWLIADPRVGEQEQALRFLRAAESQLGTAVELSHAARPTFWRRCLRTLLQPSRLRMLLIGALLLALLGAVLALPVPYRVRCRALAQPVQRRYAAAPYDGIVEQSLVEAGDLVTVGQPLAVLDGREIRWELAGVAAERERAVRERDMKLSGEAVSESLLAALDQRRLTVRQELLEHREQELTLTAPCSGVVLSSSIRRGVGKPVELGEVLYEVGPLSPLRIELDIPTSEATHVANGQQVSIWLDGVAGDPLQAKLIRIAPRAEERGDAVAFVAEVEIDNLDRQIRPGMTGTGRIETPLRPLWWCLFHKPWEWLRSTVGY